VDLRPKESPKLLEVLGSVEKAVRRAPVERTGATVQMQLTLAMDAAQLGAVRSELGKVSLPRQSQNNLKQIGLALHNYHSAWGCLPGAAICDARGKPLLSWRVAILPFIEQEKLYHQFRLHEPWDSEHNKKLLAQMPKTYAPVARAPREAHTTYYRVFTGPSAAFPEAQPGQPGGLTRGLRLSQFYDGTSNTLLVVEAGEAVPWTKPEELPFDPKKPIRKLGGMFEDGFHILLGDGSVHFVKKGITAEKLSALITPQGGEVIEWGNDIATPGSGRQRPVAPSESVKPPQK
jgi:hypothetical protein